LPPILGASWDIFLAYEFLLATLENAKTRVQELPDSDHLASFIDQGWIKLDYYYSLIADSPLIYAAAVLHPAQRWALFERAWEGGDDEGDRASWLDVAKLTVKKLWEADYKTKEVDSNGRYYKPSKRSRSSKQWFFGFKDQDIIRKSFQASHPGTSMPSSLAEPDEARDEYESWINLYVESDDLVVDPFSYWTAQASRYPRLAAMALDVLTVPPMSADCERLFSEAGQMANPQRNRLSAETISLFHTLRSWRRAGLVNELSSEVLRGTQADDVIEDKHVAYV
jgi:hypothetical protein